MPLSLFFRPSYLQDNFIFPDQILDDEKNVSLENTVRIVASFDMGWTTRGTGRTYDSLSGIAALIGLFSKKVISYVTLNRKCRMCDLGHPIEDHNCKLNFEGSAKSMEPKAAVLLVHFKSVIKGFSDTLPIIKKYNLKKGKGQNKLEVLATDLGIDISDAHNAIADVKILEQILHKFRISDAIVNEYLLSWSAIEEKETFALNLCNAFEKLKPLDQCTSSTIRKKMIVANISYNMIVESFNQNKIIGIFNLLGKNENGVVRVTKNRKVIKKIFDYLQKRQNVAKN